jgi:hypothetical protein
MADVLAHDKPKWRAVSPRTYIAQTDYLDQDFAPALKAFIAQRKRLLALLKPLSPKAWGRFAIVTSFGRTLHPTVHAYAHRLWTHERDHLNQIERIAEAVRGSAPYRSSARKSPAQPGWPVDAGGHPGRTASADDMSRRRATQLQFSGKIWVWKGPAPWYFVTVPAKQSRDLNAIMRLVTYGWGMIPVRVRIGKTEWKTALWPKDGKYIVPIKANVRKAEKLEQGDTVTIQLEVT